MIYAAFIATVSAEAIGKFPHAGVFCTPPSTVLPRVFTGSQGPPPTTLFCSFLHAHTMPLQQSEDNLK